MSDPTTARTILQQLGGNRFIVTTGAKDFVYDDNSLRFRIPRNRSKANLVTISLRGDDTYTMVFRHYIAPKLSRKTWEWTKEKDETIRRFEGVYCDQLQELFIEVTGLVTRL